MRFRKNYRKRSYGSRRGGSWKSRVRSSMGRGFRIPIIGIRVPMLALLAAAAFFFVPAFKNMVTGLWSKVTKKA